MTEIVAALATQTLIYSPGTRYKYSNLGVFLLGAIVEEVAEKTGRVEGVATSHVELVWDPPWTPDRMTEAAKLELGML